MEGHVECLIELVVLLEEPPFGEPRDEDQVPRRGNRQELGEPLHRTERERLPPRESAGHLADPERREQEGNDESHGGHGVDPGAAHWSQYRSEAP